MERKEFSRLVIGLLLLAGLVFSSACERIPIPALTPTAAPTVEPAAAPADTPTPEPTLEPTVTPVPSPTPTSEPTATATAMPMPTPTSEPIRVRIELKVEVKELTPVVIPVVVPTPVPTFVPVQLPTPTYAPPTIVFPSVLDTTGWTNTQAIDLLKKTFPGAYSDAVLAQAVVYPKSWWEEAIAKTPPEIANSEWPGPFMGWFFSRYPGIVMGYVAAETKPGAWRAVKVVAAHENKAVGLYYVIDGKLIRAGSAEGRITPFVKSAVLFR